MNETTFKIRGMHCTSCKVLIEDVGSDVPGVESCKVDYPNERVIITHDDTFDPEAFKKEIRGLGDYSLEQLV